MSYERRTTGLRDRKKLETRQALGRAALRLAYERGLDNLRVEDIAAAANVSPRTFSNYFSSKEEAIVSLGQDRVARLRDVLLARPREESLSEALAAAIASEYMGRKMPDQKERMGRLRLILGSPALRREYLHATASLEGALSEAIARRMGVSLRRTLYPHVLAATICGAERAAIRYWFDGGAKGDLTAIIKRAVLQAVEGTQKTPSRGTEQL